ncbi:MAG: FAD-linked oxidase C-terminal domain-containing protein [Gammaproteobacteria bacterium]
MSTPATIDTPHIDKPALVEEFAAFLAAGSVLHAPEELRPYECDGLSAYKQAPMIVVLPETIGQVQQVMRICHRRRVPVVARGAGTGLSGGALPLANGVLLALGKFNRILDIDVVNRCAHIQPGVRNLAISEAVAPYGLYYAPDPSSQIACSIGGNVAENSGGVHCLKYGLTVHNILRLKVVTVEGELLTIGSLAPDSAGYDLLALMTGSEGMLGVIVEVTVKLLPKPTSIQVLLAAFDDVEAAGDSVAGIIAAGIIPAGLEMMDNPAIRAVEDFVQAGYPVEAAAILLCELDGTEDEVAMQIEQVSAVVEAHGAGEVRIAKDAEQRMKFWAGRKSAFPAVGRISPDYYCIDGTIPRKHLAKVLTRTAELSAEYGLRVANVFHAGDGNLHPLILYDANNPGELERAEEFGADILKLCVEVGGVLTGEHGVGVEKRDLMGTMFNEIDLNQQQRVKCAFDPDSLLNPGKVFPQLHRCAELGRMHIHRGQMPFPDLPRF